MAKLLKKPVVEVETKKIDISVISPDVFSPHMSDVDESMEALSNMQSVIGSQILDSVI